MTPKEEAPGGRSVAWKSGLGEETQEPCAFSLDRGPCSDFTLNVYAASRDGRLDQLGGEEIPITTTPVHCLIIFLQLPVIDRAPV